MSYEEEHSLESFHTEAKANIRARQQRMRALVEYVGNNGIHIPKTRLIALFCIREGISKATVYTYLEEYLEAGIITTHGEHILMMDQYEEMKAKDAERLKELL